jgi:predicted nucleic-acid-binding Zn-ribbon protein
MIKLSALRYLLLLCGLFTLSKAFAQKSIHPDKYKLVITNHGSYGTSGLNGGLDLKFYIDVTAYLVNYSDDTLSYWGTDCNSKLFTVPKNPYMHVTDVDCKNAGFFKVDIPPHRSQKIQLMLNPDKTPDKKIIVKISMRLFKWFKTGHFTPNSQHLIKILSDTLTMRYNKDHSEYFTKEDFGLKSSKQSLVLPERNFYLLTNKDRALYKLQVDQNKILKARDTTLYQIGKCKFLNVPLKLYNNSNDTLKFMSMSCSWYEFYNTNSNKIAIPLWDCDKNIPDIIVVPPHSSFLRIIPLIYGENNIKVGAFFNLGMSLVKNDPDIFDFDSSEYTSFNIIWSNGITIP